MKKRYFVTSMVLASLVAFAAGCSQKNTENSSVSDIASAVQTEEAPNGGTLTVWCSTDFNINSMRAAEKVYQKDHPGFKVDIIDTSSNDVETKITTAVVSGDLSVLPDIFLLQDGSAQKFLKNYQEAFTDMTNCGVNFDDFADAKVAFSIYDGVNYGVPFDSGTMIAAYRLDYLEKAGFTLEDFTDITWSEFIEKGKAVKAATGYPMITNRIESTNMVTNMTKSCGDQLVNDDGSIRFIGNEVLKKSMQTYADLVNSEVMSIVSSTDEHISALMSGTAAAAIDGCWRISTIMDCPEDQKGKWGITNIPRLDDIDQATNYSTNGGSSWYVSSNSADKELAFDFLTKTFGSSMELYDTLLKEEGVISTYLPAGQSEVYGEANEWFHGQAIYKDILKYSAEVPEFNQTSYIFDFNNAIGIALTNVLYNGSDLDSEISAAADTVNFAIGN